MNGCVLVPYTKMPPSVTPEQIITYGKMIPRPLQLDVSVVAYFQEFFRPVRIKRDSTIRLKSIGHRSATIKPN